MLASPPTPNGASISLRSSVSPIQTVVPVVASKGKGIEQLRAEGVPAGPINHIDEAFDWATASAIDATVTYDESGARVVRSPIRLDGDTTTSPIPPPNLDEQGDVIRQWLSQPDP